jgi:hypothetical protein
MIETIKQKCGWWNPKCDEDATQYVTNVVESQLVSNVVCDEHLRQLVEAHRNVDFMPRLLYPNE